jgi:hypothetical protein
MQKSCEEDQEIISKYFSNPKLFFKSLKQEEQEDQRRFIKIFKQRGDISIMKMTMVKSSFINNIFNSNS